MSEDHDARWKKVVGSTQPHKSAQYDSPSGKYQLLVELFRTGEGTWEYTRASVSKHGEVIDVIHRNYHGFEFLFVENHPTGHDYLVCGESYTGQTVVELDTGKRTDYASEHNSFCWVDYKFHPEMSLIVVDGCYWACPYEYKCYDFSTPLTSLKELDLKLPSGEQAEDIDPGYGGVSPAILSDGEESIIEFYETGDSYDDPPCEEDEEGGSIVGRRSFRREGDALIQVGQWIHPQEAEIRREAQENEERWEREFEEYKKTNPLYLQVKERTGRGTLIPHTYPLSTGTTYPGWHPEEDYFEGRVCYAVHAKDGLGVRLEWGRETAPILVQVSRRGEDPTQTWFPHSEEGMKSALDLAEATATNHTATEDAQ